MLQLPQVCKSQGWEQITLVKVAAPINTCVGQVWGWGGLS